MTLKLGKAPATEPQLKLTSYVKPADLPEAPTNFGWDYVIPADGWGMLGNADYGCCVWAGAAHEQMLWAKSGGTSVRFNEAGVLHAYSAVTGFDPADPASDKGTNVADAMEYRRRTGVLDAAGRRHKTVAYAGMEAYGARVDLHQLGSAAWLFGAAGIGIRVTRTAMDQFRAGQPWDVSSDSEVLGGHYVPIVGRKDGFWHAVTWGRIQRVTDAFLTQNCDEAWAVVSVEQFHNAVNLDGLNQDEWLADIAKVPGAVVTQAPRRPRPPKPHPSKEIRA